MRRKWSDLVWAVVLLAGVAVISRFSMSPSEPASPAGGGTVTIGLVRLGMTRAEVEKLCGPYVRTKISGPREMATYTAVNLPFSMNVVYERNVVMVVAGAHFEFDGKLDDLSSLGPPDKLEADRRHATRCEYWLRYGLTGTCLGDDCRYTLTTPPIGR